MFSVQLYSYGVLTSEGKACDTFSSWSPNLVLQFHLVRTWALYQTSCSRHSLPLRFLLCRKKAIVVSSAGWHSPTQCALNTRLLPKKPRSTNLLSQFKRSLVELYGSCVAMACSEVYMRCWRSSSDKLRDDALFYKVFCVHKEEKESGQKESTWRYRLTMVAQNTVFYKDARQIRSKKATSENCVAWRW